MRSKRQQEQDHHSRSPKRLQVETSPIRLNDVIDTESPRNGTSVGDELSRDESIQVPIQEPATLHGRSPEDASPTDSVVCYGMLPGVAVQLKWLPESHQTFHQQASPGDGKGYVLMRLELNDQHGVLYAPTGESVAVLNKKSFQALDSSVVADDDHQQYRTEAWVLGTEWDARVSDLKKRSAKNRSPVKMEVDLILYGPVDNKSQKHVADSLGRCQTYLQDPHPGLFQPPYSNPQSLKVSIANAETRQRGQPLIPVLQVDQEDGTGDEMEECAERDSARLDDLIADFDVFLDMLPTHQANNLLLKDTRIISELFSHQQEAINFMVSREATPSLHSRELWQVKSSEGNETYFQHSITGAKSRSPDDFLGGILADDMGLGKTLTTLSLILASMDRAQEFMDRSQRRREKGKVRATSKATVVIVPSELLLNTWAREIERHFFPGSIRYIKYHGQERRRFDSQIFQPDVILTTYGTVMADRRRGHGILHHTDWYRLVLDEAHTVRNWSTKQFNAVNSISSHIRWCLTGTPIQNSLRDLASLVRFLKMPLFEQPAVFMEHVTKVRRRSASSSAYGEFANLRLILSAICLRRNKNVLPMHDYQVENRRPCFRPHEREQYRNLELACKRAISIGTKCQADIKSHSLVMEALLRLRMFCNNGAGSYHAQSHQSTPSTTVLDPESHPDVVLSFLQQGGEDKCAYCCVDILSVGSISDPDSNFLTPCWRLVCSDCAHQYRLAMAERSNEEYSCDLCSSNHRTPGSDNEVGQISSHSLQGQYPSKIQCLVEDVQTHYHGAKCVVFSFWKTTLDIVSSALEARGIKHLRVDGDVTPKKRNSILLDFQTKSTWRVLVMTFSTGSIGLNGLTVASRVHILEPQWNPAMENQAIGRVLRLDQQRKVTVLRYSMQRSIEEAVQTRQLRKLQLASSGFSSAKERQEQKAGQLRQLQEYFGSEV